MKKFLLIIFILFAIPDKSVFSFEKQIFFEYGIGYYANNDIVNPELGMPLIMIYQNGEIIFRGNDKLHAGKLDAVDLQQIKQFLLNDKLIHQNKYIRIKNVDAIDDHGGISYFNYFENGKQFIVSTDGIPRGGEWKKTIEFLKKYFPRDRKLFYPDSIKVEIKQIAKCENNNDNESNIWPFNAFSLTENQNKMLTIADEKIISYLYTIYYGTHSGVFCENGNGFIFITSGIEDFYGNKDLKDRLIDQRADWLEKKLKIYVRSFPNQ